MMKVEIVNISGRDCEIMVPNNVCINMAVKSFKGSNARALVKHLKAFTGCEKIFLLK